MKITAAVISNQYPSAKFISSLGFADEIIYVLDRKKSALRIKGKLHLYSRPLNSDFAAQRNFALSKSSNKWVMFVDDDEIISSELSQEILREVQSSKYAGYYISRKDLVYHQSLNFGETGDAKIIRLANKESGRFLRSVHETWKIKGQVGYLTSPLYHIKDHFVSGFISRMTMYSISDARDLTIEHKPFSYFRLFVNPVLKFIYNYFLKMGMLDGIPGLFQSYLLSTQSLTVRVFQWTSKNSS